MRITIRLKLNALISLGAVVCILLAVSWTYREIVSAERDEALAVAMHKVALERILLRDEFLLHRDQRIGAQWYAKSESLRNLIDLAETRFPPGLETQTRLREVRQNFATTLGGFSQVIKELNDRETAGIKAPTYGEATQGRIGQVFSAAHSLLADITRLHELAEQRSSRARNRGVALVLLVTCAGMLAVIGNSLLINRTLSQRLVGLGDAVRRTGEGDFSYRLTVDGGDDELAEIAGEVNTMLAALAAGDRERRRGEEQILQAKNDWQATFDAITAPIMLLDNKFRIIRANRAMARKLGLTPEQAVGLTCYQTVHGCEHPHAGCPHALLLADGCRHQAEVYEDRLGGWYLISVDPLYAPDGSLLGSVHYGEDITMRRQAQEELRTNSARLEEAQRLAHLGSWELDLRDNRLVWSAEVYRIFGLPPQEMVATYEAFLALVHPEDREKVGRAFEESLEKRGSYEIEHRILRPDGEIRHVHERCVTDYDATGRPLRSLGTVLDITERQRLEGRLRQAQKMEAIGTLAGGIAHDFNNILTAILGYGEIVMEKIGEDARLREEMAQVIRGGERARGLVKQILAFSRSSEQQEQPLLIQFVVKEALKLLRASLPASIEIREDIDVNCGLVMADPVQIHQVVMNLCTNAYHAMRESGGVLTVSLQSVPLPEVVAKTTANLPPGQQLCLAVADTGCGMSRAVQERIFEPYFTTKGKGDGTGLGLSMVHGIVTGLGGVVNVYSEPGRGSTFKVYLPLIAGEGVSPPKLTSEPPAGGDESILVVDDEESITRLERKLLEGLGYRVQPCSDSEEALRLFRDNPAAFDLLLTDMTMPRLNGDELAREILRLRPGLPIVLCTGFNDLINEEKAKGLGIREFLLKPLEKNELARAVRRALDGEVVAQGPAS